MKKLLSLVLILFTLSAIAPDVRSEDAPKSQTFAEFWAQFKAAVAKKDKEAVAGMTKFPVEIGENVSKPDFLKMYPEIFNQKVLKCFPKAKPVKDDGAPGGRTVYSVFCGQDIFLFEKVDGKFLFTGVGEND